MLNTTTAISWNLMNGISHLTNKAEACANKDVAAPQNQTARPGESASPPAPLLGVIYPISGNFMPEYTQWLSKTNNLQTVDSLIEYVTYLPQIHMVAHSSNYLSLSQLENHYLKFGRGLHNHADLEIVAAVRKQLENTPFSILLPTSDLVPDKEFEKSVVQMSQDIFQQYVRENKVQIPAHPNNDDSEMDFHTIPIYQKTSTQVLGTSENMTRLYAVDAYQGYGGISGAYAMTPNVSS